MEESTDSDLQGILDLYADTLKKTFLHLWVNISELPDLKKLTVTVDITQSWGNNITEEGSITVSKVEDREREGVIT